MTTTTLKGGKLPSDGTTNKPRQNWFRTLRTIALLTIYGIYKVVFVHKFFLHTFFRSSISDVPPPVPLNIGYGNKLQFKTILLMRYFLKDQFWGQQWLKRIHQRILNNLNKQNIDLSKLKMSIPMVEPGEISAQEFWKRYVRTNTPVIIKGGAKHTFAYQNWTMEMFRDRFGDFKVSTTNQSRNDELGVNTIKDVIDSEDKLYITFCAEIFSAYPELMDELGCLELRKYMGGNPIIGTQLFLGASTSTGSHAHCADANNMFFQLRGKKKWTFVHPDYLWLMYPMLDRFFLFCRSFVKRDYNQAYLEQYAPLQKYCPKYEAVLEPGDILFNPPWQWHAVDNLTEETIAVATRWALVGQKEANTFFDLMALSSSHIWRINFEVLMKEANAIGVLDENTGNLVKNKEDYIGLGKEDKITAWEFDKWPKDYQF